VAIVKVFMTHLQTVGIAAGFPLQWPGSVLSVMEGMSTATSVSDNLLSPDCVADQTAIVNDFDGSTFYLRAVVMIMLPFIFIAFLGVFWVLHYLFHCPACWDEGGKGGFLECLGCKRKDDKSKSSAEFDALSPVSVINPAVPSPTSAEGPTRDRKGSQFAASNPLNRPTEKAPGSSEKEEAALPHAAAAGRKNDVLPQSAGTKGAGRGILKQPIAESRLPHYIEYFIVSIIVFAFLIHPTLTRITLAMFTCTELPGTDNTYLVVDKAVQCNTSESAPWMYAVGVPFFVFYALGIPALAFFALKRHKATLDTDETRATYGFLYSSFNLDQYWWEELIMLRKVGFSIMAVLLAPLGIVSQTMLATLVLTLFAVFHARAMPYNKPVLNRLELYSLVVALFTLQGGLYLFACDVCSDVTREAITVLIIFINMVFVVAVIVALTQSLCVAGAVDKNQKRAGFFVVLATLGKVCLGAASGEGGDEGGDGDGEGSGPRRPKGPRVSTPTSPAGLSSLTGAASAPSRT
jgi:hypothetical protein